MLARDRAGVAAGGVRAQLPLGAVAVAQDAPDALELCLAAERGACGAISSSVRSISARDAAPPRRRAGSTTVASRP